VIIAIDLDGVIFDFEWDKWKADKLNYFGNLIPGAREAISELKNKGNEIIIYTSRLNSYPLPSSEFQTPSIYERVAAVEGALNRAEIPFDLLWCKIGKPVADIYIDDRGIRFQSWKETMEKIREIEKNLSS